MGRRHAPPTAHYKPTPDLSCPSLSGGDDPTTVRRHLVFTADARDGGGDGGTRPSTAVRPAPVGWAPAAAALAAGAATLPVVAAAAALTLAATPALWAVGYYWGVTPAMAASVVVVEEGAGVVEGAGRPAPSPPTPGRVAAAVAAFERAAAPAPGPGPPPPPPPLPQHPITTTTTAHTTPVVLALARPRPAAVSVDVLLAGGGGPARLELPSSAPVGGVAGAVAAALAGESEAILAGTGGGGGGGGVLGWAWQRGRGGATPGPPDPSALALVLVEERPARGRPSGGLVPSAPPSTNPAAAAVAALASATASLPPFAAAAGALAFARSARAAARRAAAPGDPRGALGAWLPYMLLPEPVARALAGSGGLGAWARAASASLASPATLSAWTATAAAASAGGGGGGHRRPTPAGGALPPPPGTVPLRVERLNAPPLTIDVAAGTPLAALAPAVERALGILAECQRLVVVERRARARAPPLSPPPAPSIATWPVRTATAAALGVVRWGARAAGLESAVGGGGGAGGGGAGAPWAVVVQPPPGLAPPGAPPLTVEVGPDATLRDVQAAVHAALASAVGAERYWRAVWADEEKKGKGSAPSASAAPPPSPGLASRLLGWGGSGPDAPDSPPPPSLPTSATLVFPAGPLGPRSGLFLSVSGRVPAFLRVGPAEATL